MFLPLGLVNPSPFLCIPLHESFPLREKWRRIFKLNFYTLINYSVEIFLHPYL